MPNRPDVHHPSSSTLPLFRFAAVLAASASVALAGCSMGRLQPASISASAVTLHGSVHGGQQPVSNASIQLYAAGTTGYGSAATGLLTNPVFTDASGSFDITGDYICPSSSSQVYITATGGNPGLPGNVNNGALALVAVLGDCGSLASVPSLSLNEITTLAAAWALAPFASTVAGVGTSSTNALGLQNAMRTAMMLADSTTGNSPAPALPANSTIEAAKLITLADIVANCVNSDGTSLCTKLFTDATAPSSTAPTDTFQAALSIVSHPANNVTALFNDAPAQAAFGGALATAPNDWTMSISHTGGGLGSPDSVAVDATGNVWVANYTGSVSGFLPQGAPLWAQGISGAGLSGSSALVIDANQNVWVANMSNSASPNQHGSVTEISASGTILSQPYGYVSGINAPVAISAAPNGSFWVGNSGQATVSLLDVNGNPLSGTGGFGTGILVQPTALISDQFSNAWIADRSAGTLTHMDSQGNTLRQASVAAMPDSLALDAAANVWVGDSTNSTLTQVASNGIPVKNISGAGLNQPRTLAFDGGGHLFVTNAGSNNLAILTDSNSATPGTFLSPATGLGLDANLLQPNGVAADASGNLWVASSGDNRLVTFVGLATPIQTPRTGLPQRP